MSLVKAASAQRPILGDSGPLQWSKKAKTECPNPNGHSTILRRLPFCLPEVALGSGYSTGRIPLGLKATAARIFEISCLPGLGRPPARPVSAGCQVCRSVRAIARADSPRSSLKRFPGPATPACPQGGFRFLGFYGLRAARSAPSGFTIRRLAIARGDQFFL